MSSSLPFINIQRDWNEVIRSPFTEAWISCKYLNDMSDHGKIKTTRNNTTGKVHVNLPNEYQYISHGPLNLVLKHIDSGLKVAFVAPTKTHYIHKHAVLAVASAINGLAVSSCEGDKLLLWDSRTNEHLLDLKGHAGPIYRCKFFPSKIVVITAGADGTSKIWSAQSGINPVTLTGHTMAVTDICIIDKGRNVITVSKDGLAKLWDCGQSQCLDNVLEGHGPINSCSLAVIANSFDVDNDREVGTGNKLLIVGCETGAVVCSHIATREGLWRKQLLSACNTCVVMEDIVIAGCDDGNIVLIKLKDGSTIKEVHESASPVLSMASLGNGMFVVGRQDGTCTALSLREAFDNVRIQLTGSDCDGIRDVTFNGKWIFTACRDSCIRKYDFNQIAVHFTFNLPSTS